MQPPIGTFKVKFMFKYMIELSLFWYITKYQILIVPRFYWSFEGDIHA
jgi:hypothetical protein